MLRSTSNSIPGGRGEGPRASGAGRRNIIQGVGEPDVRKLQEHRSFARTISFVLSLRHRSRMSVMVPRSVWFGILLAVILALGAMIAPSLYGTAILGSGFLAQLLCSSTFVSHRDPQAVVVEDMSGPGYELVPFFQWRVDRDRKRATASMFGLGHRAAIFREGLGCTLVVDATEDELRAQAGSVFPSAPSFGSRRALARRRASRSPGDVPEVDRVTLAAAVEAAFAEPDPNHLRRTRALVVVHGGRIIAERYAPGFNAAMPLIGWSMTKMATNALVGIAVQNGKLAVADKDLLPEWRGNGDERRHITLDQLLRMTSGLSFNENYEDHSSDVIQMLFVKGDKAGFAAAKPLQYSPGSDWSYSGGASNIIARSCDSASPSTATICAFPASNCSNLWVCAVRCWSRMSPARLSARASCMPLHEIGRDLASCTCATVFGRVGVCCRKVGCPIA